MKHCTHSGSCYLRSKSFYGQSIYYGKSQILFMGIVCLTFSNPPLFYIYIRGAHVTIWCSTGRDSEEREKNEIIQIIIHVVLTSCVRIFIIQYYLDAIYMM